MSENKLTFFQHLDEFRSRLFTALAAFAIASIVAYLFSEKILAFVLEPLAREVSEVYFFSPADAFVIRVKAALFAGFVLSSPVIFGEFWRFVSPALRSNEKRSVVPLAIACTLLFICGVLFCFYAVIPPALHILLGMSTAYLRPMISVSEYISFLSSMLFAFGLAFMVPAVILTLAAAGFVHPSQLNRYQGHAIVLIFVAAALLTPGPDIVSQLLLAVPLLILFEISVLGSWLVARRRAQKA